MFDRRLVANFDWVLLGLTLLIASMGVFNLYSASFFLKGISKQPFYLKQLVWSAVGLSAIVCVVMIDYRTLTRFAYVLHAASLAALIVLLFSSHSDRWLSVGPLSFQPSEVAKITLILAVAKFFTESEASAEYSLANLWFPLLLALITFLPVFLQPDLGTGGMILLVFLSLLLFVRVRIRSIVALFLSGLLVLPIFWFLLKDYQRERVLTFLNPGRDPLQAGYHIAQSKIAVGSGGFLGRGFLKGTQSQLRFLPEQHTDFVFSAWAEEWGFLGAVAVLLLFFWLLSRGLRIALHARERSGGLIAAGVCALVFWQVLINVGMVVGVFPVVGIPLPLFSYGGSSMLTTMVGIGLLLNIRMRRFVFQ
jgi:rod shape determining protein RodA